MKRINAATEHPNTTSGSKQDPRPGQETPPVSRADVVVIGNGIAGMFAARAAHRTAPHLNLAIVTRRNHPTIYTPALRHFLMGKVGREQLVAVPPDMERIQNLSVIRASVERISTSNHSLVLEGGQSLAYGKVVIATGSRPRGLPETLPGSDFDGVVTAHSLTDYLDLRRRLSEAEEIVVVGGGMQGLETVLSLLHHRLSVSWLIRTKTCLPLSLREESSQFVIERVRAAGAKVETGVEVREVLGRVGAVSGVVTSNGLTIPCELVIACTGVEPETDLASRCDRPLRYQKGRGILVDDWLQTGVMGVYAAGDVAAVKDPRTGTYLAHPHWADAERQGTLVGELLGGREITARSPLGTSWQSTTLGGKHSLLAVGDTLGSTPGAENLTEKKRGTYRQITVLHDQVIGYLSLGEHMPDPAAISYVIDEGLSLSAINDVLFLGKQGGVQESVRGRAVPPFTPTSLFPAPLHAPPNESGPLQEQAESGGKEDDMRRRRLS